MTLRRTLPAALAAAASLALAPAPAGAEGGLETTRTAPDREVVAGELLVRFRGERHERVVELPADRSIQAGLRELRSDPRVRWATPNAVARAARVPRDPGRAGVRGGWVQDQWNFLTPPSSVEQCDQSDPCGIGALRAWSLLRKLGHPDGRRRGGGRGPIVAVVDTGVAYRNRGSRHRRNPDFAPGAFTRGRDFVGDDELPLDHNGHGTHVAATIIERTDNRIAVTGIADGLRLMPVRVLNGGGAGSARDVARGIRWASRHGARVINLSLQFGTGFRNCAGLRGVCRAIRRAERGGALVVAPTGNAGSERVQMPGKVSFGVASSTIRGCLSDFSNRGRHTDITAPGGGFDARDAGSHCDPAGNGPGIVQLTLTDAAVRRSDFRRFGYPRYEGTSMAAPHVSASAALVWSSRVLARRIGHRPRPREVASWLRCTAREIPDPAAAPLYGAGLLDLPAALRRRSCPGFGSG